MLPEGILFDLDDTIIAFGAVADPVWRRICEKYAGKCELSDANILYKEIKGVSKWFWSDSERHKIGRMDLENTRRENVSMAFKQLGMDNVSLAHEIADAFSEQREKEIHFFPKAEDTLSYLVNNNVSLALITNGEAQKQRNKVKRFRLERFFKTILIEGELGYGKPDNRVYLRALDDLGLNPEAVWSIGDNLEWDVLGPQKLGIFSIWNDVKRTGLPADSSVVPDRTVNSISEIIE